MSTIPVRPVEPVLPFDLTESSSPPAVEVHVRRSAVLPATIGVAASAIATAYLYRAVETSALLDWVLCAGMALVAVTYLVALLDARTPLLVADELGVRIRLGTQWRSVPWEAVDRVVVEPRRSPLRDGRLVVLLHHLARAVEGLDGRGRRAARLNHRRYGGALAVPLGLTTRVRGSQSSLAPRIEELAQGRAEVVTVLPERQPEQGPAAGRRTLRGRLGTAVSRAGSGRSRDVDRPGGPDPSAAAVPLAPAARAIPISGDGPPTVRQRLVAGGRAAAAAAAEPVPEPASEVAPAELPESVVLRRPDTDPFGLEDTRASRDRADHPGVRRIATLRDPVEAPVVDDFAIEPAYDPVIGPQLAAARTRVGLSVDELAERTRIRPHVIESIEVDDFAPCGGDFYARGHIRTLARVLGQDVEPMLRHFEDRYASAPVNPRRVFEAELATGLSGSARRRAAGPSWTLLVGIVLVLVLVWGAVRLFAGESEPMLENPPPSLSGSAVLGSHMPDTAYPGS